MTEAVWMLQTELRPDAGDPELLLIRFVFNGKTAEGLRPRHFFFHSTLSLCILIVFGLFLNKSVRCLTDEL